MTKNVKTKKIATLCRQVGLVLLSTVLVCACLVLAFINHNRPSTAFADSGTSNSYAVKTTSYDLVDNTGYIVKTNSSKSNPLGTNLASIFVDANTTTGMVTNCGTRVVNGKLINQYGVNVGDGEITDNAIVDIMFRFNKTFTERTSGDFAGETKINGVNSAGNSGWYLSNDSAENVAGFDIGVVNSGAVVISKSYDGTNWSWVEEGKSDEVKSNFHTTDFVTGNSTEGNCGFANAYGTDKFSVYTPAGADIARGVYIKILFAYEIKYATYSYHQGGFLWLETIKDTTWHYRNILEESIFYLASNSATVAFSNASNDNVIDGESSELATRAGTILDGHGSLKGFRLNKLDNSSFTVKYRLVTPDSTPTNIWSEAYDGQYFNKTGRYDFQIITSLGDKYKNPTTNVEYYSVYVNNLDVNGAVNLYFGNPNNLMESSFITNSSTRVYSMEDDIPVYVAGQTYYKVNAVSPAYMAVAGKIFKDGDRENPIEVFNGSYAQQEGTITEPGNYVAEFYSNKDYEGTMSGDSYHFVFKFKVIAERDAFGPVTNEQLLKSIITAQDLQGSYYSIALSTQGVGKAYFAFPNYTSAYGYAYEYERAKVVATQKGYLYDGQEFVSQFDVLDRVDQNAKEHVVKRYFDASNLNTYLTIGDLVDDVTTLSLVKDIVVFSDNTIQEAMKSGEPFLNDRVVATLNEDGTISKVTMPYQFIQIADYESNSVTLINEITGDTYSIEYGVGVEQQLQFANAPSGRYKIIEKNKSELTNEYYAVYIKRGDNTAHITIDTFVDGELNSIVYTQDNNNLRSTVNGFNIVSVTNTFDAQTIVKIEKNGELLFIGTTDEVSGQLVYTEEGTYTVTLVDRLANSFTLHFNIFTEVKSSVITFDNDGELTSKIVFDGQAVDLTSPTKEGFIFKGWSDGIARYNSKYVVEGSDDRTLTAVWHYPTVNIYLYDGALYDSYINNVEDKRTLPFIVKEGYELLGWFADFGDGNGRFYYGQISSVPNVPEFRVDAIWKKTVDNNLNIEKGTNDQTIITLVNGDVVQTLTANYGQSVVLPEVSENGFIFFGWQYSLAGTIGTIYSVGQIESVPSTPQIVLYALFKTDVNYTNGSSVNGNGPANSGTITNPYPSSGTGAGLIDGENINNIASLSINNVLYILSITVLTAIAVIFIVLLLKKRKEQVKIYVDSCVGEFSVDNVQNIVAEGTAEFENNEFNSEAISTNGKRKSYRPPFNWNKLWCKKVIPIIALTLVFVFASIAILGRMPECKVVFADSNKEVATSVDYQEYQSTISNEKTLDSYLEDVESQITTYGNDNSSQRYAAYKSIVESNEELVSKIEFTEKEIFLYSLVLFDLTILGYDVFPATILSQDGTSIWGYGYTKYSNVYTLDNDDDHVYFGSGFVSFAGQTDISERVLNEDIIIVPCDVDYDAKLLNYGYILSFYEEYGDCHYVAYDTYFTYGIRDYTIYYTEWENDICNYNQELGSVYDYDLGRIIFDSKLGDDINLSAVGLNTYLDYETAKESFRAYIEQQNQNGLEVNTLNSVYISFAAYNEMKLNNQDESFLGLSPEDIYEFESSLSHKEYYYVTPDGELHKAEFPPATPEGPGFWERFAVFATALASIAIGVVILVVTTPCGGPANPIAQMAAGAFFGMGFELFSQGLAGKGIKDVNWLKVGVAAVSGALSAIPVGGALGYVVAGLIGGATDVAMKALDGEINSWEDAFKTFAIGALKAVAIRGLTQGISKVKSKLGCFVAGTAVATLGGAAAIETLRIGDLVSTRNATTGLIEYQPISHIYVYSADEITHITLSNGEVIDATPNHPFFVKNNGYILAENLRAGDILVTVNGEEVVVEQISHEILEKPVLVYNLETGDNHNYFVAQDEFGILVLVHNECRNYKVYKGKVDGKEYVGRTKQSVSTRVNQHKNANIKRVLKEVEYIDNLTKNEARGLEQKAIEIARKASSDGTISNAIDGIRWNNPNKDIYLAAAEEFLEKNGSWIWKPLG